MTVSAAARYWQAAGAELEAFEALAAAPPDDVGGLPVMVIGAELDVPDRTPVREVMDDLNRELVARIPNATYHVIEGADHLSLLTLDEHARAVGQLVETLLPQESR